MPINRYYQESSHRAKPMRSAKSMIKMEELILPVGHSDDIYKCKYFIASLDSVEGRCTPIMPISNELLMSIFFNIWSRTSLNVADFQTYITGFNIDESNIESSSISTLSLEEMFKTSHINAEAWRASFGLPKELEGRLDLNKVKGRLKHCASSEDSVQWVREIRDKE